MQKIVLLIIFSLLFTGANALWSASGTDQSIQQTEPSQQTQIKKQTKRRSGRLSHIWITEPKNETRLRLSVRKVGKYESEFVYDPDGKKSPKLIVYLYNALEDLIERVKNVRIRNGVISRVKSTQHSTDPLVTKVEISLRHNRAYTFLWDSWHRLIILFDKTKPESSAPPAVVSSKPVEQPSTKIPKRKPEHWPKLSDPARFPKIEGNVTTPGAMQFGQFSHSAATQSVSDILQVSKQMTLDPHNVVFFKDDEKIEVPPIGGMIRVHEILNVQMSPTRQLSKQVVVQADGKIQVPWIGNIKAAGLTIPELTQIIENKIIPYNDQKVEISREVFLSTQVFIAGQIRRPGAYEVAQTLTCAQLIGKAGGLLPNAYHGTVVIYRGQSGSRTKAAIRAENFINFKNASLDTPLEPGDVIEVTRDPNYVLVIGFVQSEGWVPYTHGLKITQAVGIAGGFNPIAQPNSVQLVRNQQESVKIQVVDFKKLIARKAKNVELQPEDIIHIPENRRAKAGLWKSGSWGSSLSGIAILLLSL